MVDISFVRDEISLPVAEYYEFQQYLETCCEDIDNMYLGYSSKCEALMIEQEVLGEFEDPKKIEYIEEAVSDMVKAVGNKIIAIFNKVKEFLSNLKDKFSSIFIKRESDVKKLDRIVKAHPELKDEILMHGKDLELRDYQSLKDLNRAFEEILKMSEKDKVDPKSLKGRWEKAKQKFESKSNMIVLVSGTLSAALVIATYRSKIKEAKNRLGNAEMSMQELKDKAYKSLTSRIDGINANGGSHKRVEDMGKVETMLNIYRECMGKNTEAVTQGLSTINKFTNRMAEGIDKLLSTKAGVKIMGDTKYKTHQSFKYREENRERDREKKLKDLEDEEAAKTRGRNKANREDKVAHDAEDRAAKQREIRDRLNTELQHSAQNMNTILQHERKKAAAQTKARQKAEVNLYDHNKSYRDSYIDKTYDVARAQQQGRNS